MKNIGHLRSLNPLTGPSSTAHHSTPLPSTVNHNGRVAAPDSYGFAQVGGGFAGVEQNGGSTGAPSLVLPATETKP